MKVVLLALALVLVPASAASAAGCEGDDCRDTGGFMSPHLQDSPVNVFVCSVPDSCRVNPPAGR